MPLQISQLRPSNSTTENAFSLFKNLQYQLNYLAWLLGLSASPKDLFNHSVLLRGNMLQKELVAQKKRPYENNEFE
jgi:hypothetical protein